MDMRKYRVFGQASYIDRDGTIRRINIDICTESPDEETAPTLVLAEFEQRKGANAEYDPQAQWYMLPMVEDETCKREAMSACGLVVGSEVLHKSGGSAERGADARVGVVQRVYTVRKNEKTAVKVSVDWPASRRINGDGWHRSDVLASAVILSTDEEIERRRSLNRAINEKNQERSRQQWAVLESELTAQGLRMARGTESRSSQAVNIRLSNGCNVWALPL